MKFLCENCKAKYQIGDEKVAGKTVRMKCRRCGHMIQVNASVTESSVARGLPGDPHKSASGAPPAPPAAMPRPAPSADPIPLARKAPPAGSAGTPPPPASKPPHPGSIVHEEADEEKTTIMTAPSRRFLPNASPGARPQDDGPASSRRVPSALGAMSMRPSNPPPPRPAAGSPSVSVGTPARPAPTAGRAPPPPRPSNEAGPLARTAAAAVAAQSNVRTLLGRASPQAPPAPPPKAPVAAPIRTEAAETPSPAGIAGAFARAVADPAPSSSTAASAARTPGEDWYVGVAGVPLGPIRLATIREKAAQGAVDGDSLVWREGFDEWQPLKNFPELLELVNEAHTSRASSIPGRRSSVQVTPVPPFGRAPFGRSEPPPHAIPAAASGTAAAGVSAAAGGDVSATPYAAVSVGTPHTPGAAMSPAAIGMFGTPSPEAMKVVPPQGAHANGGASLDVLSDPFRPAMPGPVGAPTAAPVQANGAQSGLVVAPLSRSDSIVDFQPHRRSGMHPMAYAFIAMAVAFGGVSAYVLLTKPPPPAPQIVVVQGATPTAAPTAAPDATVEAQVGEIQTVPGAKPGTGGARPGSKDPAPPAPGAPIDTSGFGSGVSGPTTGPGQAAGSGQGQLSQGEILGVVNQNQPLIRRKCWQPALDGRGKDGPTNAKVNANIVIGPSGDVQSVSAGGAEKDFPGLASCIGARIKGWKFPPSGGTTTANVPFVFAGQ